MTAEYRGRVEVICGSMFSGKTEELIRRVRRAQYARQEVQVFKPIIDSRWGIEKVTSHNGIDENAIPVHVSSEIIDRVLDSTRVVAIDEAQFFDAQIDAVVNQLASRQNKRIIVAGLDTDFLYRPFGRMPWLLNLADEITKLHAICNSCGEEASRTQRLVNGKPARFDDPLIMLGAAESYEARCREHHQTIIETDHGLIYVNPDRLLFRSH